MQKACYVRYQTKNQDGLFRAYHEFLDWLSLRRIRVPRKIMREIEALGFWLCKNTPEPDVSAYKDRLSPYPVTWFKSSATEWLKRAEQLCRLLNEQGADITRLSTFRPGKILYEDEVQIVTRRPRAPKGKVPDVAERRSARRRQRQATRRRNVQRRRARSLKSGI